VVYGVKIRCQKSYLNNMTINEMSYLEVTSNLYD
jgi:hypothetical protein